MKQLAQKYPENDKLRSAALVISLALLAAPLSHAGGPAFSGIFARADSAETVYNNPAGMARLDGTQMTGQGVFIKGFSQIEVQRDHNREAINTFGDLK